MQLIENPLCVALKSSSVWVGYAASICAAGVLFLPIAPDWIRNHLPVTDIVDTLKWIGLMVGPGVQGARIVKQNSLSPTGGST